MWPATQKLAAFLATAQKSSHQRPAKVILLQSAAFYATQAWTSLTEKPSWILPLALRNTLFSTDTKGWSWGFATRATAALPH